MRGFLRPRWTAGRHGATISSCSPSHLWLNHALYIKTETTPHLKHLKPSQNLVGHQHCHAGNPLISCRSKALWSGCYLQWCFDPTSWQPPLPLAHQRWRWQHLPSKLAADRWFNPCDINRAFVAVVFGCIWLMWKKQFCRDLNHF